jgi:ribosome-associated protein
VDERGGGSSDEDDDGGPPHQDGGALASRASDAGAPAYEAPADDAESRALALALARVCWETKGEDVLALHVAPLVYWTRYMVLATVFSRPQLGAILARVEKEAEDTFGRRPASAASGRSEWELLDFGDVVVHVLTAQQREYYDLVRRRCHCVWGVNGGADAERVSCVF